MANFTLGIEEEFQIVDPGSRELVSRVSEILEEGRILLGEQIKPELHQSQVETGTGICNNIQELRRDVTFLRRTIAELAAKNGLTIAAASTHPFSHWTDSKIFEHERYFRIIQDQQLLARSLLIFGLHIHVGIDDRDEMIYIMNQVRYLLPHLLTLSTSSPFWLGENTGLKSYRTEVFKMFPRTGLPDHFYTYSEFEKYVALLVKTGCIDDGKKIWWDVRPHPYFPTLEFRMCDIPSRIDETIAIAALVQALVAKFHKLYEQNMSRILYRRALIEENKWRAIRYGLDGQLIDFGKQKEMPVKELIVELLDFVDDVVDELGSRKDVEYIHTILREGTSADRQIRIYRETGDLRKVVDNIIAETLSGLEKPVST